MESIVRQFHVGVATGLTIAAAEAEFDVEVRSLTIDDGSEVLYPGRLISLEGEHDAVYRLFDRLCPGVLSEQQRSALNG